MYIVYNIALHCTMLRYIAVHLLQRIVPPLDRLWLSGKVTPDNGERLPGLKPTLQEKKKRIGNKKERKIWSVLNQDSPTPGEEDGQWRADGWRGSLPFLVGYNSL